ncbi:MAG: DUF2490 domain-containing protein [Spirochaetota bacterium]
MKHIVRSIVFAAALSGASSLGAVTRTDDVSGQYWLGYITSYRFAEKFSLWNDWHLVPGSFFVSRHGLTRHLSQQVSVTGGYAWGFLTTPGSGSEKLDRFEHRPWAQLLMNIPLGTKYTFSHRVRYDARFRQNVTNGATDSGFAFNHRVRFMIAFRRPLTGIRLWDETPFAVFGNEVLLNFAPQITGNQLDQTRTWLMLGYQTGQVTLQGGYMYRYVPSTAPATFNHYHTAVLWVTHAFGGAKPAESTQDHDDLLHRDP